MTTVQTIPLFPLGTTLFPDGLLPLKIFEVRYLDMIKKCLRESSHFGVVTIENGGEVRSAGKQTTFSDQGTLASITAFEAVQPSLFMLRCQGGDRFKVLKHQQQTNGLWVAEIALIENDHFIEIPTELKASAEALRQTLAAIIEQTQNDEELAVLEPYKFNDCAWVANRWAELLPLPPQQKLHLLGMTNPRLRLDLISEALQELGVIEP
jgi:Lon protease-like protein